MWADHESATSQKLLALTKRIAEAVKGGASEQIVNENGGAACEGFIEGCDAYDAFMFTTEIDGREYCVTVEDVTTREE